MPAPPEESEPAMVSATGTVIARLAQMVCSGPYSVLARSVIPSKLACHKPSFLAFCF